MKRISYLLALSLAAVVVGAGCTQEDVAAPATIEVDNPTSAEVMEKDGDAMEDETHSDDAMEKDGDAMEADGEAMEKDGDAMEADGEVMEKEASEAITLAEVAEHATADDCWLAIDGKVYDVSGYDASHPGGAAVLEGCGTDATTLFETRPTGSGTEHSSSARTQLENFYAGELAS